VFCYQIRKFLGAYIAVLGGLDTLVFTGGIGEHSPEVREEVCEGLEALGIAIDPDANRAGDPLISERGTKTLVRVMQTNEELVIARQVHAVLCGAGC
jgi:acetate kinase